MDGGEITFGTGMLLGLVSDERQGMGWKGRGWNGRAGDGRTTDDGAPTCEIFGPDQYIDER